LGLYPNPRGLGHEIGRNTIKRILLENGFDPIRRKGMSWETFLNSSGVETVKLPDRSPNPNAYSERFVRSIRSECLAKTIPLGEQHLRHAVKEYTEHYHAERNHYGLDNQLTMLRLFDPERFFLGRG
jgi:hypothetical protein